MRHLGDITAISGYDVPPVDMVIGGSPCQDLSIAGKRAGLAGARSGLFMEQIRLIKERGTAGPLPTEYSTHSFGESPSVAAESCLSQILEDTPHRKYFLSAKACAGILRRAERRGKKLPPELEAALIAQMDA